MPNASLLQPRLKGRNSMFLLRLILVDANPSSWSLCSQFHLFLLYPIIHLHINNMCISMFTYVASPPALLDFNFCSPLAWDFLFFIKRKLSGENEDIISATILVAGLVVAVSSPGLCLLLLGFNENHRKHKQKWQKVRGEWVRRSGDRGKKVGVEQKETLQELVHHILL